MTSIYRVNQALYHASNIKHEVLLVTTEYQYESFICPVWLAEQEQ
jgi:hypothetical protein